MRSWDERWQPGNYKKNVEAIGRLRELAQSKDIRVTQLALAWLLAQGDDIVPIPGPAARSAWRRTSAPPTWSSRPRTSTGSRRSCPGRVRQPLPRIS
jgi:hypothetical protein